MPMPMGPFFQVLLRSLSRPFSNVITNLATNHPKLRSLIFIPAGRALIRLTIRLRMQNLGFGKPATVADVTETAAIQEAAEIANFILFVSLSLAVFYMSKWVTPETAKKSDFEKAIADLKEKIMELEIKINKIEVITDPIVQSTPKISKIHVVEVNSKSGQFTGMPRTFERISILPVEEAAQLVSVISRDSFCKEESIFLSSTR